MKIHSIETGNFKLDGGAMFGVVPKSLWNKVNPADDQNMCTWALRCLLIEVGERLILIDTGIGNKQDDKFFGHYYLHNTQSLEHALASKGFSTNDVTDVVLTHLHFDHCGGAVQKNKQTGLLECVFKNATYWSNEKHWQWAVEPNAREKASFLKENILPIKESGQLKFIANHEWLANDVFPNIDVLFVNGHTEAQMLPLIHYKGEKILFCGDLFPSAAHVALPWIMAYDMRPLLTLSEKEKFLPWAAENNVLLCFEHDAQTELCSLVKTERGIKTGDRMTIDSL